MSLKAVLERMVRETDGGIGAIVMGYDGISIDEYREESEFDVPLMGVEYVSVVKEIRNTASILEMGEMQEVAVLSENVTVVMKAVTEDFFALLALRPDGNFGKARYLLKRDILALREELQ